MILHGQHNYCNAPAALALADAVNIPREGALKALRTYSGLPHRFQLVHESAGSAGLMIPKPPTSAVPKRH